MTLPALLFCILLSTVYGTAFHFWKGGDWKKLVLFVILSWVGFWIGHGVGAALKWTFAAIGPVNAGMGTLGSVIFLFVGEWLGRVEVVRK